MRKPVVNEVFTIWFSVRRVIGVWRGRIGVRIGIGVGVTIGVAIVRIGPDEARADKDAWPDEAAVEAKPRPDEAAVESRPNEGVATRSDKCAAAWSDKGGASTWADEGASPLG